MAAASRAVPLEEARLGLGLSLHRLWVDYLGLGGSLMPSEVGGFLAGWRSVADSDHDMLVQALNECYLAQGGDHPLAYMSELVTGP